MTEAVYMCWEQVLVVLCFSVYVLANTEPDLASQGGPELPVKCSQTASLPVKYALSHSVASLATSGAVHDLAPAQATNYSPTTKRNSGSSINAFVSTTKQQFTTADSTRSLDSAADNAGCAEQQQNHLTPPHKALWPLSTRDVATLLLTCITLFIAAGGGIGGGAVFVVLYVFVGGFTAPQAVALSNITILGGSVANFLANTSRRHPVLNRPLIDWDLILVMEPTTMLGALLGGYLNKLFPVWLTSCLLAGLLSLLTYKLLKRGACTFRSESRQKRLQLLLQQQDEEKQQQQQQRRRWLAAAGGDGLQEPLMLNADSCEENVGIISTGGMSQSTVTVKVTENHIDHGGAWFDAQAAGDQQQQQQQQCDDTAGSDCAASAGDLDALVVQVPAHLPRLNVTTQQQQQERQQQAALRSLQQLDLTPRSCHALNVVTPRSTQQQQQQQQRLHSIQTFPLSPGMPKTAAAAVTATPPSSLIGSSLSDTPTVPLLPQYQQYSANTSAAAAPLISSSSSSTCCLGSCCSCFNPQRLQLSTVLNYERQQLPWQPLVTLFFLSAWVVISDTSKVVMVCGSLSYWLVVLSIVPPALLVMLLVRQWLLAKTAVKEAAAAAAAAAAPAIDVCGTAPPPAAAAAGQFSVSPAGLQQHQHPPPQPILLTSTAAAAAAASIGVKPSTQYGGIHWTPRNSLLYPLLCSAAGVVAGLFGVGGGIVKGPLMLELGVCPEVSAATSATMIMFTAGSAAVVYINFGGVVTDYAIALLTLGFCFTLFGQLFTIQLVKALGRRSVIIFMMGTLMVLATVAASYQSVVAVDAAVHDPRGMWTWGSVCKHH